MHTLRELRVLHHLTQAELARVLDVSEGTVANIEKDSSNIKNQLLKKYERAFGVNADKIFLDNEYGISVFVKNKRAKVLQNLQKHQT